MSKLFHIQVLRAGAALSVAMLHAQHDAHAVAARLGAAFEPGDLFPWAAGVDVFFVISGFIMVYASRDLFAGPDGTRIFLVRRIARVVPLYWAVTTLYGAVALAAPALLNGEALSPSLVLASYLFIPVARPDGLVQPIYSLGWTLNYEMEFYAVFAFAIAWPRRRAIVVLILALVALVATGRLLAPLPAPLGFWTDPIILEFGFGAMLGLCRLEGARMGPLFRIGLAGAGLVVLALDLLRTGGLVVPRVLAYGGPAAMLVAAAAFEDGGARSAGRLARLGAALGDASYGLYLVHPFVIRAGRELAVRSRLGTIVGPWGFVALALCGATGAALLVFHVFERPLTERLRRSLERATGRAPSAPVPEP